MFKRGRTKHWVPPEQAVVTIFPPTHCPTSAPAQVTSPSVHAEPAESVAASALPFCASSPFSIHSNCIKIINFSRLFRIRSLKMEDNIRRVKGLAPGGATPVAAVAVATGTEVAS